MADVHTPEQRSYNMSRIRGKNTKPEELVRKYLFAQGFRYRKNDNRLPGKPDIVLPKYKTVIFINGFSGMVMTVAGISCGQMVQCFLDRLLLQFTFPNLNYPPPLFRKKLTVMFVAQNIS